MRFLSEKKALHYSHLNTREEFNLRNDVRDWKVSLAQKDLKSKPLSKIHIKPILYRPFDIRYTYYTGKNKGFIGQPAYAIMSHMLNQKNIGLMTTRKVEVGSFGHAICTNIIAESHSVSLKEVNYLFPLWINPNGHGLSLSKKRQPNLDPQFLKKWEKSLGSTLCLPPEDIFNYIYAVLHSPTYRNRYAEFLKIDFPRLPLTDSLVLFQYLARIGTELIALHVMESPKLNHLITKYSGSENPVVTRISWSNNIVWLDAGPKKKGLPATTGTVGFVGVSEFVWNFHIGGYQVCEKWLKDRKGRTLTGDDIAHYQKIIVAISETIRIMKEIDEVIDKHGGWPGAFQSGKEGNE